ncbi:SGNH/GDSL hydrolase family protein [Kribbella hippodromi]|uniref:SGNH/GDSL hydrolase family protein n=1 Tax=Kribbella hippodromi TaxID=434347 RepID=A0ABN2D766_9ACTN
MVERDGGRGARIVGRRTVLKAGSVVAGGVVLGASPLTKAVAGCVSYADGVVPVSDPNIRYLGRWQQAAGYVEGYYQSGLELRFTGTSTAVVLENSCRILYRVDGGAVQRNITASGTVVIAAGLGAGPHSLQFYSEYQQSFPKLKYLQIDPGARTQPVARRPVMEVIGDSISVGYIGPGLVNSLGSSFSYKAPELLGFAHNTVAFGGIATAAGSGAPDASGMVSRYTKLSEYVPGEVNVPGWDTAQYVPDCIVINLGTNDPSTGPKAINFQPAYLTFLENLRAYYPEATIFAMSPLNTAHRTEIADCVTTRNTTGDANVLFIDTTGWINPTTETTDGTHPTIPAHDKVAQNLATTIRGHLPLRPGSQLNNR